MAGRRVPGDRYVLCTKLSPTGRSPMSYAPVSQCPRWCRRYLKWTLPSKRLMGVSIYSRRLMCQQVSLCGTLRSPPPPLGDPSRGPPGHLLLAGWGTLPHRAPHDQAISFLGLAARDPMGWRLGPPSNELFHSRHRAGLISLVRRLLYQRCTTVRQAMSFCWDRACIPSLGRAG